MKKLFSMLFIAALCISTIGTLTACTKGGSTSSTKELALITDVGTIDDKSFNQGAWEGLEKYAKENNKSYKYYKPAEKSDVAYLSSIEQAVKAGAKVVVCPGYLFGKPVYEMQTKYPDVQFIILDAAPHKGDFVPSIAKNTEAIFYAEEQAGYLAGYAAVKDGYRKLGFMGGLAVPAVVRFGYGFIQGADAAAKELGLAKDDVSVKYTYVGNFDATPENQSKAAAWYNDGTEVIFACGGAAGNSVMKAAETANGKVIGVDVDQYAESNTVITSAMKNLGKSVYDAISNYYNNKFNGGKSVILDASVDGIQLPMKNSKFKTFNQAAYDKVYAQLVAGNITLKKETDAKDASKLPVELVKISIIA